LHSTYENEDSIKLIKKNILSRITNQNDLNEIRTRIRNLAGCSIFDYRKKKKEQDDDDDFEQGPIPSWL